MCRSAFCIWFVCLEFTRDSDGFWFFGCVAMSTAALSRVSKEFERAGRQATNKRLNEHRLYKYLINNNDVRAHISRAYSLPQPRQQTAPPPQCAVTAYARGLQCFRDEKQNNSDEHFAFEFLIVILCAMNAAGPAPIARNTAYDSWFGSRNSAFVVPEIVKLEKNSQRDAMMM